MEKDLKCIKVLFEDGSEEVLERVFVTALKDAGDEISVRVFASTDDEHDFMAFRLAMLNDGIETGLIKAAADEGLWDDVIKERAAKLCSNAELLND